MLSFQWTSQRQCIYHDHRNRIQSLEKGVIFCVNHRGENRNSSASKWRKKTQICIKRSRIIKRNRNIQYEGGRRERGDLDLEQYVNAMLETEQRNEESKRRSEPEVVLGKNEIGVNDLVCPCLFNMTGHFVCAWTFENWKSTSAPEQKTHIRI